MANKQDYISALRAAIEQMHGCASHWIRTDHVHETFKGKTVWDGDVEVFVLVGHAKALRAYAWAYLHGKGNGETTYVAVLEIPPVKDARTAVRASIMADSKTGQS